VLAVLEYTGAKEAIPLQVEEHVVVLPSGNKLSLG